MRHLKVHINQMRPGLISFPRVTIGSLPDNVLLDIFDFRQTHYLQSWHILMHVCRRWRYIVLESPLRLHLELECNAKTPVKKTLDVWPRSIPIIIAESRSRFPLSGANIIAALEHHDRVSQIDLKLKTTTTVLGRLYKVMKKPYPVLTRFCLQNSKLAPVLQDTFLGGSAPRLEYLNLFGIPFPGLPKFLLSCLDLVDLHLEKIPNTGYISLEAMATALSALTKLQSVEIGFEWPASRPDPTNRPPSSFTRAVLLSLTRLKFHGSSEYFGHLMARFDTPALIYVSTWFFYQLDFDIPLFAQFIGRTKIPGSFEAANLYFADRYVYAVVGPRDPNLSERTTPLSIGIPCHGLDWQVALLAQIFGKISPCLYNVQRLHIGNRYPENVLLLDWKDYADGPQWLEIFHAFSALQHMRIPPSLGEILASVLQELTGGRVMDALPMLRHLYLPPPSASMQKAIEPFISSRQRSNNPLTLHLTEMA